MRSCSLAAAARTGSPRSAAPPTCSRASRPSVTLTGTRCAHRAVYSALRSVLLMPCARPCASLPQVLATHEADLVAAASAGAPLRWLGYLSSTGACAMHACVSRLHAASDCMVAGRRVRRLRRRVGGRGVAAARHARGWQAVAARTGRGNLAAAARGARRACARLPTRRHLRRVPPCLLRAAAAAAAERGAAKQDLDAACWARAAAQARRSARAPRSVTSHAATWRTLCPCCKRAWRRRAPGAHLR
jgi:hypothetical protein